MASKTPDSVETPEAETDSPETEEAQVVEVILPEEDEDGPADSSDDDLEAVRARSEKRLSRASEEDLDDDGDFDEDGGDSDDSRESSRALVSPKSTSAPSRALDRADPLSRYMNMVRRYPVLDPEEQQSLAYRYLDDGDQEAAQKLLVSNLRLVVKIALQYWRRWADVMDLVAQGNLGLVEAIDRFDPGRGIRFPSYAQYWIRAYILAYMMDHFRIMKLSSSRAGRKLFWRLNKERRALMAEGYTPTTKLLAERVGVSEADVDAVARVLDAPAKSLHAPAAGEEGRTVGEMLPDNSAISPEFAAAENELATRLEAALAEFAEVLKDDPKGASQHLIWTKRLAAEDPETLSKLGEQLGVSRERVRQIEVKLKARARDFLTERLGKDVVEGLFRED